GLVVRAIQAVLEGAEGVAGLGLLDLDHVCAQVAQQHAGRRARDEGALLDDLEASQHRDHSCFPTCGGSAQLHSNSRPAGEGSTSWVTATSWESGMGLSPARLSMDVHHRPRYIGLQMMNFHRYHRWHQSLAGVFMGCRRRVRARSYSALPPLPLRLQAYSTTR